MERNSTVTLDPASNITGRQIAFFHAAPPLAN